MTKHTCGLQNRYATAYVDHRVLESRFLAICAYHNGVPVLLEW